MFFQTIPPVVIYCRVSSDKQRENQTIEGQLQALATFAERHDIQITGTYTDDGVTGDLPFLERPGGSRLLQDAKAGKFKTVLVYQYDRFSRDVYEGLTAARLLKDAGASPFSINEPFDINTPHGQYMFVQSLNNAQLFKAQMLERMRDGQRRAAVRGQWTTGAAPFGYRIVGKGRDKRIEPDEETILPGIEKTPADTIRWIFDEIANHGSSLSDMSDRINALRLAPPYALEGRAVESASGRKRVWRAHTIWFFVHSTTYKGEFVYGKSGKYGTVTVPVPPLVTQEVWQKAQDALVRNMLGAGRNSKTEYLLRGMLRCALCGAGYCGITKDKETFARTGGNKGRAYCCIRYSQRRGHGYDKCDATRLPGIAENLIWNDMVSYFQDPHSVAELVSSVMDHAAPVDTTDLAREVAAARVTLAAKGEERKALYRLYRTGKMPEPMLYEQLGEVEADEKKIAEHIEQLETRLTQQSAAADLAKGSLSIVAEALEKMKPENVDTVSFADKRRILTTFIDHITVHTRRDEKGKGEPTMVIHYRFTSEEKGSITCDMVLPGLSSLRGKVVRAE